MKVHKPIVRPRAFLGGIDPSFYVRPGTCDVKAIEEVWKHANYVRPRLGFYPEPGQKWLDLGSNIGAFAVMAAKLGADVTCVEAEPTNASICRANLELNNVRATVVDAAIVPDSHPEDVVVLNVNSGPMALRRHSIVQWRKGTTPLEVRAYRIGDVVRDFRPTHLKINIEGVEIPILTAWTPPDFVRGLVFEWSFEANVDMAPFRLALDRLRSRFENVRMNKGMDLSRPVADFYPPNVHVFAWS